MSSVMAFFMMATLSLPDARAQTAPAVPARGSDFEPESPQDAQATLMPAATQPDRIAIYVDDRGIRDEQIGAAIDRGVGFLLQQFKDGEIAPQVALSSAQREALDALCVYALASAGQSTGDSRIDRHGALLNTMLDKLCAVDLGSDGKVLNRPIVYGRSLRAAAVTVLNRPKDQNVLKADVKWLIASQVNGAYSYDDTEVGLLQAGLMPANDAKSIAGRNQVGAPMSNRDEFGGGSGDPTYVPGSGPYGPPMSPLSPPGGLRMPTPTGSPTTANGRGSYGPAKHVEIPNAMNARPEPYRPSPPRPFMLRMVNHWPPQRKRPAPVDGGLGRMGKSDGLHGAMSGPVGDNQVPKTTVSIEFPWDNSNSQYGLLGVWAGAEVGMEVPDAYWAAVENHWKSTQFKTGEWGYKNHDTGGYYAMTCAGLASLLVTHDYLDLPMLRGAVGRASYSPNLRAGLDWLELADNSIATSNLQTHYVGYDLFGIERVGLACGYKYFGSHNWYRELTTEVLAGQFPNGAWGREDHGLDTIVETAYDLLYLSRGRHPVMMTKLKFDGAWDNRPRDVAHLARFAGSELEQPLNWQVVSIGHPWYDWFDSPVVFIASHQAPNLRERNYVELRSFVQAGGLIFTQADMSAPAFDNWVKTLAEKVAPGHPLEPIPASDPIYSINYKIASHRLMGVRNGVRWLIVHSPSDIAMAWQQRSTKTRLADFQTGTNVFLYASGKPDLRIKNRLESPYIPEPSFKPTQTIRIARVRFDGNWDPEPAAWGRFSRWLQWETGVALRVGAVSAEKLTPGLAPIAALTGTGPVKFTDAEITAVRNYVTAGGVLLVDPCGGDSTFQVAIHETLLDRITSDARPMAIMPDSVLRRGLAGGTGVIPLRLRRYSLEKFGNAVGGVQVLTLGKGAIIVSPRDLTFGLLGVETWSVDGYRPDAVQTSMKNLIEWAASR